MALQSPLQGNAQNWFNSLPANVQQGIRDNPRGTRKSFTEKIGDWVNDITGVTAQQNWQQMMRDSSILSTADQYEAIGLNPSLLYGQGASAASTPSGPSGGGRANIPSIDGLVNSAANLINSQTRAYQVDRYNKHLDWREKDQIDRTTIEIFDKLGDLVMSQARTKTSKR